MATRFGCLVSSCLVTRYHKNYITVNFVGYPRPGQMPYVSAATNGLWATGAATIPRSTACRQNRDFIAFLKGI